LVQATIEAALSNGELSAHVATLATGVMQTMFTPRLQMAAALILCFGLAGSGIGVVAYRTLGRDTEPVSTETIASEQPAGPAVNGLKLSLTADKTGTVMKADGSNAEPVKLRLTFTNVSNKPIKLDTYLWTMPHQRFEYSVVGPDDQSVEIHRIF